MTIVPLVATFEIALSLLLTAFDISFGKEIRLGAKPLQSEIILDRASNVHRSQFNGVSLSWFLKKPSRSSSASFIWPLKTL